jgi:hypothetical protein
MNNYLELRNKTVGNNKATKIIPPITEPEPFQQKKITGHYPKTLSNFRALFTNS